MLPHRAQGKVETSSHGTDRYIWISDAPGPGVFLSASPLLVVQQPCPSLLPARFSHRWQYAFWPLPGSPPRLWSQKSQGKAGLGPLPTFNQSTVTKREQRVRNGADHSNHKGWHWGKGEKNSSQKMGDTCSEKKGKTICASPVLPRTKAHKAFKLGGR